MAQHIQELIEKIKNEGIQTAQQEADQLLAAATKKAEDVVRNARQEAERIIKDAEQQAEKTKKSTSQALLQSSRDTLLTVRSEIQKMLKGIVDANVKEALSPKALADIIASAVKEYLGSHDAQGGIQVTLSEENMTKLKDGIVGQLKEEVKRPIEIKATEDISNGFLISFDEGKSSFDFSDASLADFLSVYVNAEVSKLLENTAGE